MLLFPCKLVAVTADCDDHGYNAYDFGWTDDDGSGDLGPNCWLRACSDGIVLAIVNSHPDYPDDEGYGNYIIIRYPAEGYVSLFAHIKKDSFVVKVGDRVSQRQRVCRQDNSGYSRGAHLHMEICRGSSFVRHGGVDYLAEGIIYADEWNIVRESTQKEYNIRHVVIQPTIEDVSKTQVLVTCDDLLVRRGPGRSYESVGLALPGYYDVELISEDADYTWANVANTEYWVAANVDGDSELIEAAFLPTEPDETKNQAEVTIDDLRIRLEPSTTSKIMGFAPEGYYDVEDSHSGDDYVWLKCCGFWIACVDGVTYHAGHDDKDEEIKRLKEQVAVLQELVEVKDAEIKELGVQLTAAATDMALIRAITDKYPAA